MGVRVQFSDGGASKNSDGVVSKTWVAEWQKVSNLCIPIENGTCFSFANY